MQRNSFAHLLALIARLGLLAATTHTAFAGKRALAMPWGCEVAR